MNILFITNNINQTGGVERVISNLSDGFIEKLNFNVDIVSLYSKENNLFFKFNDNVNIIHKNMTQIEIKSLKDKIKNRELLIDGIKESIHRKKYDVIMTFHSYISHAVLANKKLIYGKIVVTEHGNYDNYSMLRKIINNMNYRKADKVVVLTEHDKEKYDRFLSNVCVIRNCIPFNTSKISLYNNKRVIAVGRLEAEKGFDLLIDAFGMLSEKYGDWKLDIIGEGSQKDNLMDKIIRYNLKNVNILPFTNDVKSELLKSSIYSLTSRTEGFPLVILEAMECGLSCVSFDLPSSKEMIINNEDGLLAKSYDIKDFANKLSILMDSYELRKQYGESAKYNVQKYNMDNILIKWKELIDSLL